MSKANIGTINSFLRYAGLGCIKKYTFQIQISHNLLQ